MIVPINRAKRILAAQPHDSPEGQPAPYQLRLPCYSK
jgi:hypothetical protein